MVARPSEHLYSWTVEHHPSGQRFRHSTLKVMVLGTDAFSRAKSDCIPRPSQEARARTLVLGYCDGERTASEIEATVLRDHPQLFPSAKAISQFVDDVLGRDTE